MLDQTAAWANAGEVDALLSRVELLEGKITGTGLYALNTESFCLHKISKSDIALPPSLW